MALQDCLDKFGPSITDEQRKVLTDAKAAGMTDDQAVRTAQLVAHQNVVDIASRVVEEGGSLAPVSNPVADMIQFQSRAVAKIDERRAEIRAEVKVMQDHYANITDLNQHFRTLVKKQFLDLDTVLMDAILQFQWTHRSDLKAGGAIMGLSGKDQFELLDNYRKMEVYKGEIEHNFLKLNKELAALQKRRNSILSGEGTGDQTLYQGPAAGLPKLMVLHNMSAESLKFTDNIGGLAVPSMAVMPEGSALSSFGEISFIGTQDMGDPSKVPLLDADGYTVRYPEPVWSTVKKSDAEALRMEFIGWDIMFEGSSSIGVSDNILEHSRRKPDAYSLFNSMLDSAAAQAKYLSEVHNVKVDASIKVNTPRYAWGWDKSIVDFFANVPDVNNLAWEDPKRIAIYKKAAKVVAKAAEASHRKRLKAAGLKGEELEKRLSFILESTSMVNADGTLSLSAWDSLRSDLQRKDGESLDVTGSYMLVYSAMQGTPGAVEGYNGWVSDKVQSLMGDPKLKINGKLVDWNLENIVRKMKGKLRGQEFMDNQMTEGLMRAQVSHRFKLLEEARTRAETHISDEQAVKLARDEVQNRMRNWTAEMAKYYEHLDHTGHVDHYHATDDAMRAIVSWQLGKGMGTAVQFEEALIRNGFPNVTEEMVDEGMILAMDWMAVPVPYFESKPQRAVMLEDFAGVVIPSDATAETRAILAKRGVPFKEYQVGEGIDKNQSRQDAVTEFTQQLSNQGERTLYQSDIGFTSGLLTAAKVMPFTKTMKDGVEVGTDSKQVMATLVKQPNVTEQEMEWIGVPQWAEAMGKITQDQLIEFIAAGGVEIRESWYVGADDPPVTVGNSAWDQTDVPMSWYDEETGRPDEGVMAFEPRILNWTVNHPNYLVIFDTEAGNVHVLNEDTGEYIPVGGQPNAQQLAHAEEAIDEDLLRAHGKVSDHPEGADVRGQAKWTEYTLGHDVDVKPQGTNHREIVMSVPTVGGYKYSMDDLTETDHPDDGSPTRLRSEVERESEQYHFIDAASPMEASGQQNRPDGLRRVQTFRIPKDPFDTIEKAKQYIIDEKPLDPPGNMNYSSHAYPQDNIIVWNRVSDRVGPNGEKILFVEEVQSDLHQAGLSQGYHYTDAQKERSYNALEVLEVKAAKMLQNLDEPFVGYDNGREALRVYRRDMEDPATNTAFRDPFENLTKKQHAMMKNAVAAFYKNEKIQLGGPTPNMPWKGDAWAELGIKRLIRIAAEGGYDQVAWTTGVQQMEHYNLSDHFSKVEYDPRSERLVTYDLNGRMVDDTHYRIEELAGVMGAEPAMEIQKKIDEAERRWEVVILQKRGSYNMTAEQIEAGASTQTVDPQDGFMGANEQRWLSENGEVYGLMDENGEMLHQSFGDYHLAETLDGIDVIKQDMMYEGNLPTITDLTMDDEETHSLKTRYDKLMVNVTNRVARKLDKSAKVKRFGGRVTGELIEPKTNYWRIKNEQGKVLTYADEAAAKNAQALGRAQGNAYELLAPTTFEEGAIVHALDLTPQLKAMAMEGQTLFQDNNRASITFREGQGAIMRMKDSRDLSSFAHEGAHLYLRMMGDLAEMPDASERLIDDFTRTLNYLGVNKRSEITVEHDELYARSWEAYLREGKAPTAELQPLFTEFSGWMRTIYQQITQLLGPGEQLTDEIRGVFDRMVATDEQIKNSEDFMGYVALYSSAEEMGVTQRVFNMYRENMDRAHNEVVDIESTKKIKSMLWAKQKWWRDELKKVEAEVRAEAEATRVYKAIHFLQRGKSPDGTKSQLEHFKLSKESVMEILQGSQETIKKLPGRGKFGIYSLKNGVDADFAADLLGYSSGRDMIAEIMGAPNMEQYIRDEAKTRMTALHPDPLTDPSLIEEVNRAVHNEKRGRALAAELSAARKQMREHEKAVKVDRKDQAESEKQAREANKGQLPKREDYAHIKAAAKKVIEGMRFRDINPRTYLNAERKAGRLAFEAMAKKDYETAYAQKRTQIMQYEAYRAAVRAKDQMTRDQKYLKGFEKTAKRKKMGKAGVLDEIDAILDGINFSARSNKQLDQDPLRSELLPSLRQAVEDGTLIIPESVLASMVTPEGTNWRDMTVEDFAGVRDVIKQLEQQAKRDLMIIINDEQVVIKKAVTEVADSIGANNAVTPIPLGDGGLGRKMKLSIRSGIGHWLRSSSIARILDDGGFGAVTRNIIVRIRKAQVEKLLPRQHKAKQDVAAIYQKHYTNKELSGLSGFTAMDAVRAVGRIGESRENKLARLREPEKMSKSSIIALGLNWGSESNRAAVLGGVLKDVNNKKSPAFTQEFVDRMLATLDKRDWAFIQEIWDYQDSYRAELFETERRRRGIAPDKVEALPFTITTSDGYEIEVKGGYHPLQYNREHGGRVTEEEFQDIYNSMLNGSYVSASTKAGATHNRVDKHGKVVLLSLNIIDRNLNEIIRDISIGDEINLAYRILHSEEVDSAARNTGTSELLSELQLWLSDAAVGELPAQSVWEFGLAWTRVGFTKSKLAFNVMVTALQLTGVTQSMAVIGSMNYARGVGKFITNPAGNYKMVMEKSAFMQARYGGELHTWDKDVNDTNAFMKSMFGPVPTAFKTGVDALGHYYFLPIAKAQSVVDVTTWMGAYEKGLNELGLNEKGATDYADTQVEASQTSGLFTDRSGIERGTLGSRTRQGQFVRLWTTLISYMLAKGNIAYEKGVHFKKKPSMKEAVMLATDYMLLFMVEGIASALLYGMRPGDEDEDETITGWIAKVTADSVMSGIPLVREVSQAKYASGNTPVGAFVTDLYKFNAQMAQGEVDEAFVKAGIKVGGTLFHMPASQPNRFVEAAMSDDDAELYEYIIGKVDK